jgi:hypothetical protein
MGPAYCMCTCDNKRMSNVYKKSISRAVGSVYDPGKKLFLTSKILGN